MSVITDLAHVDRLIDRHLALTEVRRRADASDASEPTAVSRTTPGPWISVSRQMGSGGAAIATMLAERLGWHVFDREVLDTVAHNTNTRDRLLASLDERLLPPLQDWVSRLIVPDHPGTYGFTVEVMKVMSAIALRGNAVMIGRGANWFLDARHGLRLRVVAPLDHRVAAVARQEGLTRDAAGRRVSEDDARRSAFLRRMFRRDPDDPTGYDLTLNTELIPPETAVEVALVALRRKLPKAARPIG